HVVDLCSWRSEMANLTALELFRRRYLGESLDEGSELEDVTAVSSHEETVVARLTREEFREAVNEISQQAPSDYRDVIIARFSLELTDDEIAHLYDWPKSKVYLTAFRALAWLKKRLETKHGPSI